MNSIKGALKTSPLYTPLTRNIWTKIKAQTGDKDARLNDLAFAVMRQFLRHDSNFFDIGCHNGLYLDQALRFAPNGFHHGFEPLPYLADFLRHRYRNRDNVLIHQTALSSRKGDQEFHYNKTNPGWSGLKRREYPSKHDELEVLSLTAQCIDDLLTDRDRADLMKLDVEGAEMDVLKGARKTIQRDSPLLIFEYGLGGSEYYDAWPEKMFDFLSDCDLQIAPLETFSDLFEPLTRHKFIDYFHNHSGFYFVAFSKAHESRLNP